MKIKDLVTESRRPERIPVEVEYEHEFEKDGELETVPVTFECIVTVTPDQYDTGDSPTDYSVEIKSAHRNDNKQSFNWKTLSKKQIAWIEDRAVGKARD